MISSFEILAVSVAKDASDQIRARRLAHRDRLPNFGLIYNFRPTLLRWALAGKNNVLFRKLISVNSRGSWAEPCAKRILYWTCQESQLMWKTSKYLGVLFLDITKWNTGALLRGQSFHESKFRETNTCLAGRQITDTSVDYFTVRTGTASRMQGPVSVSLTPASPLTLLLITFNSCTQTSTWMLRKQPLRWA